MSMAVTKSALRDSIPSKKHATSAIGTIPRWKGPMMSEYIWTDEALSRLLGACDGFASGLIAVRNKIAHFDGAYAGRFNSRHTRKIERRDAITKPLRELADQIETSLRDCQKVYRLEYDRAHPRAAVGAPSK